MKKLIVISAIFLAGCTSSEIQQKISANQDLITNSKDVTVFFNSKEIQEIKVEDSKASKNSGAGILPALIFAKVDDVIQERNDDKSNRYTIDFNERLKNIHSKNSINVEFINAVIAQLKSKGYTVNLIETDSSNLEKYNNNTGLKIFLDIKTGYLSPENSFLFEPNRVINYQVTHNSTILSTGKVGGVGGWISDKYLTYNKLSNDAENARNILKKYLMGEVDSTVHQILNISKGNVK